MDLLAGDGVEPANRNELTITETDDSAIAAAAIMGESSWPVSG